MKEKASPILLSVPWAIRSLDERSAEDNAHNPTLPDRSWMEGRYEDDTQELKARPVKYEKRSTEVPAPFSDPLCVSSARRMFR